MLGKACVNCKHVLLCQTISIAQPLVCPVCHVEWLYVAPNGVGLFGKPAKDSHAIGFADIPIAGCPKGPKSKRCPVCDRFEYEKIQSNFDERVDEKPTNSSRRSKLCKDTKIYIKNMKERLKERGRYKIHQKDLPSWSPSDEVKPDTENKGGGDGS